MFCPKCGNENQDTNRFCKKCGRQLPERSAVNVAPTSGLIGHVLDGKYRIDAKLGSGGMGDVYQATRLLIGDQVAIKVLHAHMASDVQAAERFRREAVTATKLRHRNVVTIFDVGIAAGHNVPYILMELADGYSLRQMITENGRLPLDYAVTVTTQVCSALDEAHRLGIVHRDIKPENIIANPTGNGWHIKILDFGIAKLYDQADIGLTQDGTAMGTPQYMSPEQCMGEALDGRSDIYSVAIVLYEMLCGTVPFKGPTALAVSNYQVHSEPAPPRSHNPAIHKDVETVILRALVKQPTGRPATASQFAQELIQAATAAYRSGHTAVSPAPVPTPAVTPDFVPVEMATDKATAVAEGPSEDIRGEATEILPQAAILFDTSTQEDSEPVDEEPEKTAVMAEDAGLASPPVSAEVDEETGGNGVAKVDEEPAVEDIALENIENRLPKVDVVPAAPTEDLSLVFADAETLVDEVFIDVSPADPVVEAAPARQVEAPATAGVSLPLGTITATNVAEPVAQPATEEALEAATIDSGPDGSPVFAGSAATGRTLWIPVLAIGGVLLIGAVALVGGGVWYFASSGESRSAALPAEPSRPEPPTGMVFVPGGEFKMGSNSGDEHSRPEHYVTVGPFFMDITEVTNEAYKQFVDAAGYKAPPQWKDGTFPPDKERFPVTGVTWHDAVAYAQWAGKRLPTEQEWELAARGTDGRLYPWGAKWDTKMANAAGASRGLREVGQGGTSPFGLYDMSGNAWEWTASEAKAYPGGQDPKSKLQLKVIRGGYFGSTASDATAVKRAYWGATGEADYGNTTIRCAKDIN